MPHESTTDDVDALDAIGVMTGSIDAARGHDRRGDSVAWTRDTHPFETEFAGFLQETEVGTDIGFTLPLPGYDDLEFEVLYVADRPGVRELRCTHELVIWLVRDRYVFFTDRDGELLLADWTWTDTHDSEIDTDWAP